MTKRSQAMLAIILAVALTPASLTPALGQAHPDWSKARYFYSSYGFARIVTNSEVFGGKLLTSVSPISTPYPGPTPEENDGITLEALWANECEPVDEQIVRLSRDVQLPGEPAKTQVSLFVVGLMDKPAPLRSIKFRVNDTLVHTEAKADDDNDDGKPDGIPTRDNRTMVTVPGTAFRYGSNTIKVIATKKETAKRANWCSGDNIWGVGMELLTDYRADYTAVVPHGSGTGGASVGRLPVTIENKGPTHTVYPLQFSFSAWSDDVQVNKAYGYRNDAAMTECLGQAGSARGWTLTCPLPLLAPGETFSFEVLVGWTTAQKFPSTVYFAYYTPGYFETTETLLNNGEGFGGTGKPERTIVITLPDESASPSPSP